jgi:hypothetical protein
MQTIDDHQTHKAQAPGLLLDNHSQIPCPHQHLAPHEPLDTLWVAQPWLSHFLYRTTKTVTVIHTPKDM